MQTRDTIIFLLLGCVKMYNHPYLDPDKAYNTLQCKVQIDIRFFFARRGSENMGFGQMKTFRSMLCTLCQNKLCFYNSISMQLCGFHCIIWYSICILVSFPVILLISCYSMWFTGSSCGQEVPNGFRY